MHKNDTNNNEIDKYGKVVAASRQNTIYTMTTYEIIVRFGKPF